MESKAGKKIPHRGICHKHWDYRSKIKSHRRNPTTNGKTKSKQERPIETRHKHSEPGNNQSIMKIAKRRYRMLSDGKNHANLCVSLSIPATTDVALVKPWDELPFHLWLSEIAILLLWQGHWWASIPFPLLRSHQTGSVVIKPQDSRFITGVGHTNF